MIKVRWRRTREKVRQILEDLDDKGIVYPPVPLDRIAKDMGIEVRYKPADGDISAFIARKDGRIVIGINTRQHPNRQRFSLAHELGHAALHQGRALYVDRVPKFRDSYSSTGKDPEEVEANHFASELLMPEAALRRDVETMGSELSDDEFIERLAECYKVSVQAMTIRLQSLKLLPASLEPEK